MPKIYVRTLLFSTAKRGHVLESLHAVLLGESARCSFGIWVHGDETLVRGSGLFVGERGVSSAHHFLLPDGVDYQFESGRCTVEIYATTLGGRRAHRLWTLDLEISTEMAAALNSRGAGVYFDWNPQSTAYDAHIDARPQTPDLPPWARDSVPSS